MHLGSGALLPDSHDSDIKHKGGGLFLFVPNENHWKCHLLLRMLKTVYELW